MDVGPLGHHAARNQTAKRDGLLQEAAEIQFPVSAEATFIPTTSNQSEDRDSNRDLFARAGWSNEKALHVVDNLVENYTAHILHTQQLSVYGV